MAAFLGAAVAAKRGRRWPASRRKWARVKVAKKKVRAHRLFKEAWERAGHDEGSALPVLPEVITCSHRGSRQAIGRLVTQSVSLDGSCRDAILKEASATPVVSRCGGNSESSGSMLVPWVGSFQRESAGRNAATILSLRYSSVWQPQARRWRARILLWRCSTRQRASLFSGRPTVTPGTWCGNRGVAS